MIVLFCRVVESLAGSADRTVKFWDLETFELIGSAGPEVLDLYVIDSSSNFL